MGPHPRLHFAVELLYIPLSMALLYFLSRRLSPIGELGYFLGFVVAFVALLFIPGYEIATSLFEAQKWRFLALVPVLGFGFQLLMIELTYVSSLFVSEGRVPIIEFMAISSLVLFVIGAFSRRTRKSNLRITFPVLVKDNLVLILLIGIGLAVRLYFFGSAYTPAPDGALYLAQARNVVSGGNLFANVSGDSLVIPKWSEFGLSTHPFAVNSLILFFWMGGSSYSTGKIMALFSGLMLVGTSYYLSKVVFGWKAAIIAGALVALHPWLVFWSVVLYGPEILACLWLLTFLLLLSLRGIGAYAKPVALGAILTLLVGSDYPISWAALVALPLLLYLFGSSTKRVSAFLVSIILVAVSTPSVYFASRPDFFLLTEVPQWFWVTAIAPPAAYILVHLSGRTGLWLKHLLALFTILDLGLQTLLARAYELTRAYPIALLIAVPGSSLATVAEYYQTSISFYRFVSGESLFWQLFTGAAGLVIFWAGVLSIFIFNRVKQRLIYSAIAIAGSLIYTFATGLTGFITADWWNYRLVLSFIPIFAILTASIIDSPIFSYLTRFQNIQRIPTVAVIGSILVIIALSSYIPIYSQISPALGVFGHEDLWAPVAAWAESTQANSSFLTLSPYLWNWLTSRASVTLQIPEGQSLEMESLFSQIRKANADYVILDDANPQTKSLVSAYFSDPVRLPPGFLLSFTHEAGGIRVWVYNVDQINSFPVTPSVSTLNLIEDTQVYAGTPNATYGDLKVLTIGWGSDLSESIVYLKFNATFLPPNAEVLDVRLQFYVSYSYVSQQVTQPLVTNAKFTNSSWSAQNLTWSNQPPLGLTALSVVSLSSNYRGFVTFRFSTGAYFGQSISVALLPVGIPTIFRYAAILSKEGAVGTDTPPPTIDLIYLVH